LKLEEKEKRHSTRKGKGQFRRITKRGKRSCGTKPEKKKSKIGGGGSFGS